MSGTLSEQEMRKAIEEIAGFMKGHDALMSCHCIVCSPARERGIRDMLDKVPGPFGVQKGIWVHPWCPKETVYLPQTVEELGTITMMLDDLGERMTGKKCLQPGCDDRPVEFTKTDNGVRLGLCKTHGRIMNDSSFGAEDAHHAVTGE